MRIWNNKNFRRRSGCSWEYCFIWSGQTGCVRGNVLWTRTIGGSGDEIGHAVIQATDGSLVVVGHTNSFGAGSFDVCVARLDTLGNLLWTRTIGNSAEDRAYSVTETITGEIVMVGYTYSFGQGYSDIYIIKLDRYGNLSCSAGCISSSGGMTDSGGGIGSGGLVSSGGTTGSGGSAGTGGVVVKICPWMALFYCGDKQGGFLAE